MLFIGIDGGLNGGIVGINEHQEVVLKKVMPVIKGDKSEFDIPAIDEIFNELHEAYEGRVYVVLEKAHVRPVQGIRAAFTTGFCFGLFQAVLSCNGLSYEIVNPTVWMKAVFAGMNSDDKKASVMWCQRKWPSVDWRATEHCTKAHDGLTDAAAMAYYCFEKNRIIQ